MFVIVKQPLTYITQMPTEKLQEYAQEYLGKEEVTENEIKANEIQIANKYELIDMNLLGVNFGDDPSTAFSKDAEQKASYFTLIVPVLSLVFSILQTKLAQKQSNLTDEQKEQQKTMNLMMPLLSAYISFIMPLALGIYWLLGNVLQMITQWLVKKMLKKQKIMLGEGGK